MRAKKVETRPCDNCGADITRAPCEFREQAYCDKKCYWDSGHHAERTKARMQELSEALSITLPCTNCSENVTRPQSQAVAKQPFCGRACREKYRLSSAEPKIGADGYVTMFVGRGYPGADKQGQIRVHRKVMQEHLGRPLLREENVHHKNGNRQDNRLENLELWNTSQPAGQRVQDKVEWARHILALYDS
jgi:hypothetical protein